MTSRYCYKYVDIANGYNIQYGNTTFPVLASGSDTLPSTNYAGFPPLQTVPTVEPQLVNSAAIGTGSIGYKINGIDITNNCAAFSITYNTTPSGLITIPSWATKMAYVLCGGGGGGGGGATITGDKQYGTGGAGGGGAAMAVVLPFPTQGVYSSFNLTIGTGGAGGNIDTEPTDTGGNPGYAGSPGYRL
jgi:hypothetical protein